MFTIKINNSLIIRDIDYFRVSDLSKHFLSTTECKYNFNLKFARFLIKNRNLIKHIYCDDKLEIHYSPQS